MAVAVNSLLFGCFGTASVEDRRSPSLMLMMNSWSALISRRRAHRSPNSS
jgi:hypothetical protein